MNATIIAGMDDDELENFLWGWLKLVSGLPGDLVRPAFQAEPPPIPEFGITWMAFNVKDKDPDWDACVSRDGTTVARIERLTITLTYYGPKAGGVDTAMRMLIPVGSSRNLLTQNYFGYVDYSKPIKVSEKIKGRMQRRVESELVLTRTLQSAYEVPHIASVEGTIMSSASSVSFAVKPPKK